MSDSIIRTAPAEDRGVTVDVSHATPELVALLLKYFNAKTRANVDETMAYFSREVVTYVDATLGWIFPSWDVLNETFGKFMPAWAKTARSYPTRIVGDTSGAMVLFTSSPELFGAEIRAIGSISLRNGKIDRWVDHWDGRHYGLAGVESTRTPADEFPQDFRESTVGDHASSVMKGVVSSLTTAFANADANTAAALFTDDAAFEDLALHTTVVGRTSIAGYLQRVLNRIPYGGEGVKVRHTVGSAQGGGYEWTAPGVVPLGAVALELDPGRRISRFTAVWDSSLVTTGELLPLLAATIEE